jgi:uncharacterized protein YndB with AHSA1/START domain
MISPGRASHTTAVDRSALTFTMERVFAAPRERVFAALSSCEALTRWWAPAPWTLSACEMDFRVGGTWLYCMKGPDGSETWGKEVYEEIVAPERIVALDSFADAEGRTNPDLPSQRFRFELIDEGGATRLRNTAFYERIEDLETVLAMGMEEGSTASWDQLEVVLDALASSEPVR